MYEWPIIREIVQLFSTVLEWIHAVVPSYGWSIVVLTVLFRSALLPLDIKSKLSMKKQALLQPKIAKINEKYKNDKEKAAQKTMELYKQEKASPLSGCLPAIIQMPLFIAFFGALNIMAGQQLHSLYELIQTGGLQAAKDAIEPWLWVKNVWAPDTAYFGPDSINFMNLNSSVIPPYLAVMAMPAFKEISESLYTMTMNPLMNATSATWNGWFILPLLAGITSWWQTKITMPAQPAAQAANQPKNPLSGKAMQYIFPVISLFFTASSNSVFALYWIASNLVSIATYKGVDIVWKMKEHKREEEEKLKLEAATAAEAQKPAAKDAHGKTQPKEGNKK